MKACASCGRERLLVALHGERGGPDVCIDCSSTIHADAKRKRQRTQVNLDAMFDTLFNGGGMFARGKYAGRYELDSDLLKDVLALTHPDLHPTRRELATHVSARLTAMKDDALPPRPPPELPEPRDGSETSESGRPEIPVTSPEPSCELDCQRTLSHDMWCDLCRAQWEARDERRRRAHRLARTASECWECATGLEGGVWLIRRHGLDIYLIGGDSMTLPHCESCWTPLADKLGRWERHDYTSPCKACRRRVTSAHGWHGARRAWTCSQRCSAALRRDRRGTPTATCARCGGEFEPARKDAAYCSAKCRQAAYRDRQRDGSDQYPHAGRLIAVTREEAPPT